MNKVILFLLITASAWANASDYVEGKDYRKVAGIPEVQKSVVREFFSYNCPHCYRKDPTIEKMAELIKSDIAFVRTPVGAGRASWIMAQEAYYVANQLKITEQVHSAIFKYIHEQGGPFTSSSQLEAFFVSQGVKQSDFEKVYNAPAKQVELNKWEIQIQLAEIRGVPTLLVNGIYEVNPGDHSAEELAKLVEYLNKK